MQDTWSKDFVEHLRTVHFALLTLCVALVLFASSTKRHEHYRAQQQILRLLDGNLLKKPAITIWETKHPKTANSTPEELGKDAKGTPLSVEDVLSKNCDLPDKPRSCKAAYIRMVVVRIADSDFCLDVTAPTAMDIDNLSPDLSKSPAESYVLNTFEGVRNFWESLDKGTQFRTIGDLENFQASIDGAPIENISLRVSPSTFHYRCIPLQIQSLKASGAGWTELRREPSVWKFLNENDRVLLSGSVQANAHEIRVTAESTVTIASFVHNDFSAADSKLFTDLSFNNEFPEAVKFVHDRGLETNQLRDINAEALRVLEKEDNPANVGGMALPADWITPCGMLLVVGFQLYFWIHLCEASSRIQPDGAGWEVAWIGVYRRPLARAIFACSACLIPAATLLGLAGLEIKGNYGSLPDAEAPLLLMSPLLGIILAWLTYREIGTMHRRQS